MFATGVTGVDYSNSDVKLAQKAVDFVGNGVHGGLNFLSWVFTDQCEGCGPLPAEVATPEKAVSVSDHSSDLLILSDTAIAADHVKSLARRRSNMADSGVSASYLADLDRDIDKELANLSQMTGVPFALDHGYLVNPVIDDQERQLAGGSYETPQIAPLLPNIGGSEMVDADITVLGTPSAEKAPWSTVSEDLSGQVGSGLYLMEQAAGNKKTVDDPVDLTDFRREHILNRHAPGVGKTGKSEFPADWDEAKILHEISDVATDPKSTVIPGRWGADRIQGTRDGVDITVDLYPLNSKHAGKISTAYPTNTPINPKFGNWYV